MNLLRKTRAFFSSRNITLSALLSLGVAAGCTLINQVDEQQCATNADCTRRGGAFATSVCGVQGVCVALRVEEAGAGGNAGQAGAAGAGGSAGEAGAGGSDAGQAGAAGSGQCTTNQDCVAQIGGQVVCKQGTCVPLTSSRCTKTIGDVTDNPELFIGVMAPLQGIKATIGNSYVGAIETAFNEFKVQSQGALVGIKAPMLIVCDELAAPEEAAKHLIETVGAKVILGPSWGTAIQKTLPLILASNTIAMLPFHDDPLLEDTPNTKGQLWSCKPNRSSVPLFWGNAIGEVEKHIKARTPEIDTLRVAVVAAGDSSSQSLALRLASKTSFNGKTEEANATAGDFFKISYGDEQVGDVSYPTVATQILNNASGKIPNLVVLISPPGGTQGLIPALETAWPTSGSPAPQRPYYLIVGDSDGIEPTLAKPIDVTLRERYLALDWQRTPETLQNLTAFRDAYKARFNGQTPRPESEYAYDCFWMSQYAVYAASNKGKLPLSSLDGATYASQGISVLNPPGEPRNVGASGVSAVLSTLAAGGDADLTGASSLLDFELTRGTPGANARLSCIQDSKLIASGLEFNAKTGEVSGTNACP
jgi:hypothetical protein